MYRIGEREEPRKRVEAERVPLSAVISRGA